MINYGIRGLGWIERFQEKLQYKCFVWHFELSGKVSIIIDTLVYMSHYICIDSISKNMYWVTSMSHLKRDQSLNALIVWSNYQISVYHIIMDRLIDLFTDMHLKFDRQMNSFATLLCASHIITRSCLYQQLNSKRIDWCMSLFDPCFLLTFLFLFIG